MSKQSREVRSQATRVRQKAEWHPIAERQGDSAGLQRTSPGSLQGEPLDAQVAMLERLNVVQRRAEVQRISRVQGNRHVQRLVDRLNQSEAADASFQERSAPLTRAPQTAVQRRRPVTHGYRVPSRPRTRKHGSQSYEYRRLKDIYGAKSLYVTGGKPAKQTRTAPYAGIEFTDPKQNWLEECYLVASLSALAKNHPKVIKDAIQPVVSGGKTRYQVTLYKKKNRSYVKQIVTVDPRPLYARVKKTKRVGRDRLKLYHCAILKGTTTIAEGNVMLGRVWTPNRHGLLNRGTGHGYDITVGNTAYSLMADGSGKTDLKSAVAGRKATWPYKHKFKHGLERVGVEAISQHPKTSVPINELWPVVLEKAIAQLLGGYQKLYSQRGPAQAGKILSMLTGKDSQTERVRGSQSAVKRKILSFHKSRRPMIALCDRKSVSLGLERRHYYAITDVTPMGTNDVADLSLRDPRGSDSKFGLNGEGDLLWTDFRKHFSAVVAGEV